MHWLLDHTEVSFILDNLALYDICQSKLNILKPDYSNINKLISKVISSLTTSLRFEGEMYVDPSEFQTSLVPFPRLHFMITGMSPIISNGERKVSKMDLNEITLNCFTPDYWFVKVNDFIAEEDKYMSISLNYRGDVKSKEANSTVQWLKKNNKVWFVDWCPTGFKIGMSDIPTPVTTNDDIKFSKINAFMASNNVCIMRPIYSRITKPFDLLYHKKSFVHWYLKEGIEESDFFEAREDLGFLEKDYLDVICDDATDEDDFDDDEY